MKNTRHWPADGFSLFVEDSDDAYAPHPGLDIEEMPEIGKCRQAQLLAGVIRYHDN